MSYIGAINKLIGENGLFPSRSELVRVAVRDFLLRELKMAKNMAEYDRSEEEVEEAFDEENFVRVPIETINESSEPIREFKSYKIIKRLEFNDSEVEPKKIDREEFRGKVKLNESFNDIPPPIELRPSNTRRTQKILS
jgi:Arc/MetJ-type ribon-helix-helix transcriptional regulator